MLYTTRCKICGGMIEYESSSSAVECPYCGNVTEQNEARSKFAHLYTKADDAWDRKDFDEAIALYEQIVNEDYMQAEAHLGIALCRYGIVYEIDPVKSVKMPTCNRINRGSILNDKNYLAAIKHSSPNERAKYESRALEIDRISKEFLKIVDKEAARDVFISYKRSDERGGRTLDSQIAKKLYLFLRDKGYNVFFAEESLKEVGGEKYEPYIFAALTSAKVMVLLGSRKDYFEATWVKNEWKRFLALSETDPSKTLIPAYIQCDPYNALPAELLSIQAFDALSPVFNEEIADIISRKIKQAKEPAKPKAEGQSLKDKYAQADKVTRLVTLTDCNEDFATNVLIQCHGDVKKAQQFIEDDPEYKKSLWYCTECGAKNTHEKCKKCGLSKKDSTSLARARKEMEEREKKKSAEYRQKKAKAAKNVFVAILILAALAALAYFVVWPNVIYPNMPSDDLYTPEIVNSYGGWYYADHTGEGVLTITECTEDGKISGTFEFAADDQHGRYSITGQITEKKNNGNATILITAGEWIIKPESLGMLGDMTLKIKDGASEIVCPEFDINWGISDDSHMPADEIYTPEIITSYSGSYNNSGEAVVTILSCDKNGNLTGEFEFIKDNNYGKYTLTGRITKKQKNNNLELELTAGEWIIQPDNFSTLDVMYVQITGNFNYFYCSDYSMNWTVGQNSENTISTVEDLAKLSNSESVYYLTSDIDLGGVAFTPISGFSGTLIGNGFSIKNLSISSSSSDVGFFSTLDGTVINLTLENVNINASGSGSNVGALCGTLKGNVSNVLVASGSVNAPLCENVGGIAGTIAKLGNYSIALLENRASVTGKSYVGGIAGFFGKKENQSYSSCEAIIEVLKNSGNITASGNYAGGIFGQINCDNTGNIQAIYATSLENTGNVGGASYVGGIVGEFISDTEKSYIDRAKCSASITAEAIVGCIAGKTGNILVTNCENDGSSLTATKYASVEGIKYAYVGGFVGEGARITNCTNKVKIEYTSDGRYVGGIAGCISYLGDFTYEGLENTVEISGTDYVGGIAGYFGGKWNESYSQRTVTMNLLKNTARITANGSYVGGIFGELYADNTGNVQLIEMYDFESTGDVSGKTYVGGILGKATSDTEKSILDRASYEGSISAEAMVGCIAGFVDKITLNNCKNEGSTLSATKYVTEDGKKLAYVGGIVGYGFIVKNSKNSVEVNYESDGLYVGGIAGKIDILGNYTIENLENTANVYGKEYVGGIFGYIGGNWNESYSSVLITFNFLTNKADIYATGSYVGGIFGEAYFKNTGSSQAIMMYDTSVEGDVSGTTYVGGIIGNAYTNSSKSMIDGASYYGRITAEAMVGCIAGKADGLILNNCSNNGSSLTATKYITTDGKKYAYVGGLVGYGYEVNNSTNYVDINYTSEGMYVAGIIGYIGRLGNITMENLENCADISGADYVGGIFGYFGGSMNVSYSEVTIKFSNLSNSGTISGKNYVGGLIGELYCKNTGDKQTVYLYDSSNYGEILGTSYRGGIFGSAYTNSTKSYISNCYAGGVSAFGYAENMKEN